MDKGYVDFYRLFHLIHMKHAFFVTQAKDNIMLYEVVNSSEVDQSTGVISDEEIRLIGTKTSK